MYCTINKFGKLIAFGELDYVINTTFSSMFSYSLEWPKGEVDKDVIDILINKCEKFGIVLFKSL